LKNLNAFPKSDIRFVEPMYALAVQSLPEGKEWFYEIKLDGYRALAGRDSTGVSIWSRRGNNFIGQFPQIARACERLPQDTLLDGEIVALDENGRISFNLLQHHRSKAQAILFYAFDVLTYRGRSLLQMPLENRREALGEIFKNAGKAGAIALSETMEARPADLVQVVKEFGFEGIVAKKKDSIAPRGIKLN
jgi:ATP-dependent DNA ligase